ncbi:MULTISPECIES: hypothetical protein [unclassified Acidovorax]|uniref:hypothetical protein n=1 Tax=unclassified Acidovorax TaxID=2684926 RepID=UPI000B4040E0|nr:MULTISPECIES: hypothetical protein [unclassified Acidovorax]
MSQARQYEELPAPESHWRPLALLGPVVALFLMGLTFLFWQAADREVEAKKRQAFTASADRIVDSLKDRMATFELVLRGVKGYYDGSDSIDRNELLAPTEN